MTLQIDDLTLRYPGRSEATLADISLEVRGGEMVGVTGATGAGKSSLCLAGAGFIPRVVRASVAGSVRIGKVDALTSSLGDLAGQVGVVFSTPGLQLSTSKTSVREELAFGLENLAVPRTEMDERIDRTLSRLHIEHLAEREPLALSGGEQQRVAIASIVVMGTDLLVLDEPTAQLDPVGTRDIADVLADLARDGRAVLVAEHAQTILSQVQRLITLEHGRAVAVASDEARAPLPEIVGIRDVDPVPVSVEDLRYRYGDVEALGGVSLSFEPGERVAIVGQNGSGKTTLVKHLNGLLRPASGKVLVGGAEISSRSVSDVARQVGFVFQNPDDQLFHGRVDREVGFGPRNLGLEPPAVERLVANSLELVGLAAERATNPYDLGFSLRKLVALASVVAMEPPVFVLDEPTTGQDAGGVRRIGEIVDAWANRGRTVIAITHDMDFAAQHFERVVVMRDGRVLLDGPPERVFAADQAATLATTGLIPPGAQ